MTDGSLDWTSLAIRSRRRKQTLDARRHTTSPGQQRKKQRSGTSPHPAITAFWDH